MAFIKITGFEAKVYVPDEESRPGRKKHLCTDCFYCQWCGDDRCELCLSYKTCQKKKVGLKESDPACFQGKGDKDPDQGPSGPA